MRTAAASLLYWRLLCCALWFACAAPSPAWAQAGVTLDEIHHAMASRERARIELRLSAPIDAPSAYAIFDPPRIVVDLVGVSPALADKTLLVNAGIVRSVTAVQSAGRTRVVINLLRAVPYEIRTEGALIQITIGAARPEGDARPQGPGETDLAVRDIGFVRGEGEEGRVLITLSGGAGQAAVRERGRTLVVDLYGASLPERLARRLDVLDFATPVWAIESSRADGSVRVVITLASPASHLAYRHGDVLTVAVAPLRAEEEPPAQLSLFR
jgi:type IV pilus assembly protein PilQ